jgi:hypothetical protein
MQKTQEMTPTGHLNTTMMITLSQSLEIYFARYDSKNFKVTGISNKMDMSKNDFLCHRSDEES